MNYNLMKMREASKAIDRKVSILQFMSYEEFPIVHEVLNAEINELCEEILRLSHD